MEVDVTKCSTTLFPGPFFSEHGGTWTRAQGSGPRRTRSKLITSGTNCDCLRGQKRISLKMSCDQKHVKINFIDLLCEFVPHALFHSKIACASRTWARCPSQQTRAHILIKRPFSARPPLPLLRKSFGICAQCRSTKTRFCDVEMLLRKAATVGFACEQFNRKFDAL